MVDICLMSSRLRLLCVLLGSFSPQRADSSAQPIAVPLADFARGALTALDNFRVAAFYERGAKEFPEDTHGDSLGWHEGFSEVWLYAIRSARVALTGILESRYDDAPDIPATSMVKELRDAEHRLLLARTDDEMREAWRASRDLLRSEGSIGALLARLTSSAADMLFSKSLAGRGGPMALQVADSVTGLLAPQISENVSTANANVLLANGVIMPRIGLGTTFLEGADGEETVVRAIRDHGYRLIDTAQSYNNEAAIGNAAVASGVSRSKLFLITKLSASDDHKTAARVRATVERQLMELRTSYIDLYFLHGPVEFPQGSLRAWRVLEELYSAGVIRSLGVSNFNVEQLKDFGRLISVQPHVVQNKFSIYHHGDAPMPSEPFIYEVLALKQSVAFIGYCNLDVWPNVLEPLRDPHVARIAMRHNRTIAQVLLRHALQMGTTIIPKTAGREGRLAENIDVLDFVLTNDELMRLNALAQLPAMHYIEHVTDLYKIWSDPTRAVTDEL